MSIANVMPVCEQIALQMEKRLLRMTTGLYPTSPVTEVIRAKRNADYSPHNYQIVLTVGEPEEDPEESHPGNPPAIGYKMEFLIKGHLLPSESDSQPIDQLCAIFDADIRRAVTAGGVEWYRFGDWAVNARVGATTNFDRDGGIGGVTVPVIVTYRISENDPYESRA